MQRMATANLLSYARGAVQVLWQSLATQQVCSNDAGLANAAWSHHQQGPRMGDAKQK